MSVVATTRKAATFRRLATDHLDESYRLARAILGNRGEAEDAVHDAFVHAWRKWSSLRDPDRFEAWFRRILVNSCHDRLRASARRQVRDLSDEMARGGPDPYRQTDDRAQISRALTSLSPDHRVVIALRFYRDLTVKEIAQLLGIREGTVNSRLHYALHDLRAVLEKADAQEQTNV